jgi:Uma2 family endonuclease
MRVSTFKSLKGFIMTKTIANQPVETTDDLLTYDDYVTFPENDGIRKEIIEGELFMSPAPSIRHQKILKKLFKMIDNHVIKHNLGEVYFAPCDVILSHINIIQPDILYISNQNLKILKELNIQGPPDLVVEILSPSTTDNDRIFKKRIYRKFGVKEYWIVDYEDNTIELWTLANQQVQFHVKAQATVLFESKILPELKIDLSLVFAE